MSIKRLQPMVMTESTYLSKNNEFTKAKTSSQRRNTVFYAPYSFVFVRILALQTDKEKIIERFCHDGECVVLMTYYHGLSFLFAIVREIIITIVIFISIGISIMWGFSILWTFLGAFGIWFVLAFYNILKAYIDWCYDFVLVTTDKVILVDQSSIFKQEVKPIHLDNIGAIGTESQFMDIFPFGTIKINLKEGLGGDDVTLRYVPRYKKVGGQISAVLTRFQRHGEGEASSGQALSRNPNYGYEASQPAVQQPIQQSQPTARQTAPTQPPPAPQPQPQQTPPMQTPPTAPPPSPAPHSTPPPPHQPEATPPPNPAQNGNGMQPPVPPTAG